MKDLSLEYAHIYTNSHVNDEHVLALEILKPYAQKKKNSLVVMVDDYSFPDPTFNYDEFIEWLDSKQSRPDIVIRESQLIPYCDKVINLIRNESLKNNLISYIQRGKYPCSLFIATWYLIRLGKIRSDLFPEQEVSKKLLNILPKSFRPFEEKAQEIIEATIFKNQMINIKYKYFAGRDI